MPWDDLAGEISELFGDTGPDLVEQADQVRTAARVRRWRDRLADEELNHASPRARKRRARTARDEARAAEAFRFLSQARQRRLRHAGWVTTKDGKTLWVRG